MLYSINRHTIILSLLLLAACRTPQTARVNKDLKLPETFQHHSRDSGSMADVNWKSFFSDTTLQSLIQTGLENNPGLGMALQRIRSAQAQLLLARNARLPMLEAMLGGGVTKFGKYTIDGVGNFDTNLSPNISKDQRIPVVTPDLWMGFRSSWEMDIWGRLNDKKKAAFSRLLASEKERQWLVTQLVAQIAQLYYELLSLDTELDILEKNKRLQEDALNVIRIQKTGGRATELAVKQFEAQLYSTSSYLIRVKQAMVETENGLNLLLGRFPQPITRKKQLFDQQLTVDRRTGLPSGLLLRRPDIQAATLQLLSADREIAAARKSFLPAFTIAPYVAFNSFNLAQWINPASVAYGFAGGLAAPVLNRNQLKASLEQAAASEGEAWHGYRQTVMQAFQEVETSLSAIGNHSSIHELKKKEATALDEAVGSARELYLTGYASYLEVITAQKSYLEAQLESVATYRSVLLAQVDLYRSLGGGWQ